VWGRGVDRPLGWWKWGPVLEAGLTVASLPFGSCWAVFCLGTFDARANSRGSLAGIVCRTGDGCCFVFSVHEDRVYVVRADWRVRDVRRWGGGEPINCGAPGGGVTNCQRELG